MFNSSVIGTTAGCASLTALCLPACLLGWSLPHPFPKPDVQEYTCLTQEPCGDGWAFLFQTRRFLITAAVSLQTHVAGRHAWHCLSVWVTQLSND